MAEIVQTTVSQVRWILTDAAQMWDVVHDIKVNPDRELAITMIQPQGWRGSIQFRDDPETGETTWQMELNNEAGLTVQATIGDVIVLTGTLLQQFTGEQFAAMNPS